jgi:hypothetical protein
LSGSNGFIDVQKLCSMLGIAAGSITFVVGCVGLVGVFNNE